MKLLCMLLAMKQYESHFISLLWRLDFIDLILQKGNHCYKFLTMGLEDTMNKRQASGGKWEGSRTNVKGSHNHRCNAVREKCGPTQLKPDFILV